MTGNDGGEQHWSDRLPLGEAVRATRIVRLAREAMAGSEPLFQMDMALMNERWLCGLTGGTPRTDLREVTA